MKEPKGKEEMDERTPLLQGLVVDGNRYFSDTAFVLNVVQGCLWQ